jgi:3-hydroxyisobutyrate dehydrogenase
MAKERIGFIGLGIMGLPMASNLLKAGYELNVFTRSQIKAKELLDSGAKWRQSPAKVAGESDIVITCLPDTPDVKYAMLGDSGVIAGGKPGLICIDMSTISPKVTVEIARALKENGIALLDCPVSGGEIGAIQAKLSIMAGGDEKVLEKAMPVLEKLGKQVTYCGPSGSGQKTKLVNQIMVVHTVMSMAEGLAFAERAGLDLKKTLEATSAGAAGSNSLKVLGAKVVDGDYKPAFMIDLQQKDLRLVLEMADEMKQPLPGVSLIRQLLMVLQAQGRGRDGTQALIDVIRQMGNSDAV